MYLLIERVVSSFISMTYLEIRGNERGILEKTAFVQSVSQSIAPMVPVLAGVFVITAHVMTGNDITATQVYFKHSRIHLNLTSKFVKFFLYVCLRWDVLWYNVVRLSVVHTLDNNSKTLSPTFYETLVNCSYLLT